MRYGFTFVTRDGFYDTAILTLTAVMAAIDCDLSNEFDDDSLICLFTSIGCGYIVVLRFVRSSSQAANDVIDEGDHLPVRIDEC